VMVRLTGQRIWASVSVYVYARGQMATRGWGAGSDMKEFDDEQGAGNARQYGRNRPENARARVRRGPQSF
jgi:hypothetical protein